MKYYLYVLISPVDNNCFYIGITNNPRRRFKQHLDGKCASTKGFISGLIERGLKPLHILVAEFEFREEAHDLERALIKESIQSKTPLCNNRYGRVRHASLSNHGAVWGDVESLRVSDMHKNGANVATIALVMGRSRSSIRWALRRLGLMDGASDQAKPFKHLRASDRPHRLDNHTGSQI